MYYRLALYMIIQTAMLAFGQMFLKMGMNAYPEWSWSWSCIWNQILTNWWMMSAIVLLVIGNIFWLWLLKYYPFSVVYPLTSIGFIFAMICGMLIFHESVNWLQWCGVVLIMLGCFFIVK